MKSMKYLAIASAIMLVLTGCEKKERPVQTDNKTNITATDEAKELQVVERPAVVCDNEDLKARVADFIRNDVHKSALNFLKQTSGAVEFEETLKAKLSSLPIEVHDLKTQGESCVANVHLVLSESDVENANKVFAKAETTLAKQASQMGIALEDGHRLVGELVYQINGEALSIQSDDNPVIELASSGLASAVVMAAQKPVVDKPQTVKPKVVPIQPATPPKPQQPVSSNNTAQNTTPPKTQVVTPPKPRVEQPTRQTEPKREPSKPAEPKVEPRPVPRVNTSPTPKPEPKVEHKPVTDNSSEITIIESDDTY